MLTVTKQQLFAFLHCGAKTYKAFREDDESRDVGGACLLDRATFNALKLCDLRRIVADSHMSENHLGGDDLVTLADDVLAALDAGYELVTWYGPQTETLVAGYRSSDGIEIAR